MGSISDWLTWTSIITTAPRATSVNPTQLSTGQITEETTANLTQQSIAPTIEEITANPTEETVAQTTKEITANPTEETSAQITEEAFVTIEPLPYKLVYPHQPTQSPFDKCLQLYSYGECVVVLG